MRRIKWMLKQLLPLKYESTYRKGAELLRTHVTWRMWFGKCFNIVERKVI